MRKVGITGGIGSGKSTVCRLFSLYGVAVYDSDAHAKRLMDTDPALAAAITALLGPAAYGGGRLDRAYVASRVFADRALLDALDAVVHPAVGRDFLRWAERQEGPYVIMECAILYESGFDRLVDAVVAVTAPPDVRVARAVGRGGADEAAVRARIAHQMDADAVAARAGYTIDNDGLHSLIEQVDTLHKTFSHGG